ncbi:metal-dependent hydrolase [Campylobacter sp. MIT 99-7217]|uniref:aminofutalosine deaminase family hydrolase n=1 Tax=Campylobacter sp. MIT 99-7217 TaxID=535091 RepID=UPI00115AB9DB|nr:metal-dependent hydrolase [Campylobacter sp. MIT 99-7217]TQR29357.1 metal-dependent hydrolase [Campylobacter sp. MIT 99-7217]
MNIIEARYIFLCDEDFSILENKAFVFDEKIIEIANLKDLQKKYPQAKHIKTPKNSLILPAFINPHTHLEFSANASNLEFGDFLIWLKSVISCRDFLSKEAKEELILKTIKSMQKSGTATIGEISSFGSDLSACVKSSMRVIFFNEILGVSKENSEEKKLEFMKRFNESLKFKNELFIPAISVHSPYSTNENLARFALNLAKEKNLLVSTHFLENSYENLWLRKSRGKFKKWLEFFEKDPKPNYDINSFLKLFEKQRTLFTHCVYLKEFELLDKNLHSITHCAMSNRLLGKKTFDIKKALKNGINTHLGTDGLSSNTSLSMLDEMRANLMIHSYLELEKFAKILILMATLKPAKALDLNLGEIKAGKEADFSVFEVNECSLNQLPLHFILQSKEVASLFIKGKKCDL